MAGTGRELTDDVLAQAIQEFCKQNKGIMASEGEQDGRKRWLLSPGDIIVYCKDGKLECATSGVKMDLAKIIMDMWESVGEEATQTSRLAKRSSIGITSRSQAGSVPGSALDAVRGCQATEKPTYSPGGGRKAAAAKTNIAALMELGGSLHIRDRIHEENYIEYQVAASLGEQVVESSISIFKQEYLAKKAWEWIVRVLIKDPGIVVGVDSYGMPEFREGAEIKIRIQEDDNSFLVGLPAKIALWREMAREWQSAGRVCETKAYSRAADMLLRGDFQNREEKAEELSEVRAIQENAKAEVL
jgi:hypothetical protein